MRPELDCESIAVFERVLPYLFDDGVADPVCRDPGSVTGWCLLEVSAIDHKHSVNTELIYQKQLQIACALIYRWLPP